jgi:formamidase
MGTAPSAELLAMWNAREQALIDTDPERLPPLALSPETEFGVLGRCPNRSTPGSPRRRSGPVRRGSTTAKWTPRTCPWAAGSSIRCSSTVPTCPGTVDPRFSEWIAFSDTSVTLDGEQRYLDWHLSYQRACLHAIDYLSKFGYSPRQTYLILGAAPIEGRLTGVVDIQNACATVYIPTAIFDFDVRPSARLCADPRTRFRRRFVRFCGS